MAEQVVDVPDHPCSATPLGPQCRVRLPRERQQLVERRLHQGQQQVVLGAEVVVDGRLRDAQPIGDVLQAGALEPVLAEELQRRVEHPLRAGRPAAARREPGRGRRR
jgi:hypothetical protein